MEQAILAYLEQVGLMEDLPASEVKRRSLAAIHERIKDVICERSLPSHTTLTLSATELAAVYLVLLGNTERDVIEKDALARLDALHKCANYMREHGQSKLADAMVAFYDPRWAGE